jgi:hypothetical protein
MNNLPATFSLRNHFSSFPLFGPRSRSQAPPEARYFFRRNHFSSCRPAEPVRLEAAREVGFAREPRHSFRGNHFSSFLPPETGAAGSNDIGLTGDRRSFFAGTTFPHSVGFTDAPLAATLSSSSFSSPLLQGGSGIPAVPKTGASVLRLLPPTS